MSLRSLQPSSSAPAYCDIVPLFSQSIAFNRTGAHWPNWKGLWPAFHLSSSRTGCRTCRAQGGMWEVGIHLCGVSFFCCTFVFLSPSLSVSVSHCLMPSDGCGNILREMSILFPIDPILYYHAGAPIDAEGGRKSAAVSKKNVFIFRLFASFFERCHICALPLFKFAPSFLHGRQNLKGPIALMRNVL